jgi:tetratricopeptide (TPR) repeat protein
LDIPFIRFAFPLIILYFYWNTLVANPWVEEAADGNPNALSVTKAQQLLTQSKKMVQAGQFREALAPSLQLYKAFPENHIYIEQLAQIYDALGQYAESAPMWEHYLQYAPTPTDGCPMLGFAYENLGQPELAFKAHERCWQFEQNNSDMIFFYAHGLERQGEYKHAAQLYQQGLKRSPEYPDLLIGLARAQMQTGQFAAARKNIGHVLEKRPDNTDALFAEGLLHARLGETRAAVRSLEHAHRMSPGYKEAEVLLAQLRGQTLRHSK